MTTVSQRPVLLDRSVRANVEYGLRLRGRRDREGEVRARWRMVGLAALEGQSARTLSGGEAQRVALARAMVIRPDVLLLDEPTANLDPYNVGVIEDAVRRLNAERGTTVVLVTHNVFQARRLAHRVALILEGKIVEVADAADVLRSSGRPAGARLCARRNGVLSPKATAPASRRGGPTGLHGRFPLSPCFAALPAACPAGQRTSRASPCLPGDVGGNPSISQLPV